MPRSPLRRHPPGDAVGGRCAVVSALTEGLPALVRTGFTLVMPRWGGWNERPSGKRGGVRHLLSGTARGADARRARLGLSPSADLAGLDMMISDLAPCLAAEYAAVSLDQGTPARMRVTGARHRRSGRPLRTGQ